MPCKQERAITLFLFVVVVYFCTFRVCHSVNLRRREGDSSASWKRIKRWRVVEQVVGGQQHLHKVRRESDAFDEEPRSYFSVPTLHEAGSGFEPIGLSWALGNVSVGPKSSASGSEDGYQADFIGSLDVRGGQGVVLGPSFDSSQHLFEWLAMRPVVQCDDDVMIFTAFGQGFTHLLVDREGSSPISLFQLPPQCRYSVRKSWTDLKVVVPYDACYVTQENGSFVLPMLWLGSPLKLSCPVKSTLGLSSSLSAPSVFCSRHTMAVQIHAHEKDIQVLGVMVNGGWGPFVSEECAYADKSEHEELTFFVPYSAACVIIGDDLHLHLILDDRTYILSCPASSQFPFVTPPPTSSPAKPQFPYIPDHGSPASTTPPQPPTQEQIPQYPYYLYPGLEYFQLPQVYPPGPQPARPPLPPLGSPPGPQHQQQQIFYLMEPGKIPYSREFPGMYYPYVPGDPEVTAAPTTEVTTTTVPPATLPPKPPRSHHYFEYSFGIPYYPIPIAAPVTEAPPTTPPPMSPPKQHVDADYQFTPFYPPSFYNYPYGPFSYLTPVIETESPSAPPPTTTRMVPHPPDRPSYPQTVPQKPAHIPHFKCFMRWMVVYLPFAHPDSIQVRDQMKTWLFLSSVSPLCGYMIQIAEGSGVILHSPLPACHSQSRTPTTISLPLRFWDFSVAQYRTMEPQCPYERIPEILAPPSQPVSPSIIEETIGPSILPKPKVSCSSHQMTLELPSGPISGIVVKDIQGNQINLQDAPKHCGYSVRKGKDGKIHLSLQLHSRCHMSMQGKLYIITVIYMTENGIREGQFSCPVVVPVAGKECNLPSQQRLPCGPSAVSQLQCRSMGCCFNKRPPACYYPIDECTVDRHFVFSVPASLTEPPLSPSMLVTAGNSSCKPHKVTSDFALFKIPMDGCGTQRVRVGQAVIYMVEVVNKVHAISLNYGTITRDSPVRLLVECRFLPGTVLTVGYMVKTPTLGPGVQTQGIFGVQLRIAKDAQYSSFHPQYHQPLEMLLGKPLYLEVRLLNSPDPSLVLLVHFCVAYPRSATAVWVLLYNGCPNPLDPAPQQAVLSDPQTPTTRGQTRRFTISTFQFLPDGEFMDPDEEIYFMCSTEICSPSDGPCVEGCFGQ